MPFFSTAQNSPKAGTATRGLRELMTLNEGKRRFDINNEQKLEALTAKKQEESRLKNLSQSLLGLKTFDQENVTAWAIGNSVSADELTALQPVMDQRKNQKVFAPVDTATQTGQENIITGQRFVKDKPKKVITRTEDGAVNQYDPDTDKLISTRKLPETKEPVVKLIDKEDDNFIWQVDPTTNEIKNRVRKPIIEGTSGGKTGLTKPDKVSDWYLKTKTEIEKAYYGDNLEPTDVQRQNFDRAMLKAESLISETANAFNISHEAAVPYAMRQIRQEKTWAVDAENSLPEVSRNMVTGGSTNDTIDSVKQMQANGMPNDVIGEALSNKGWSPAETAEIMTAAAQLIPASTAGFNLTKLRNTRIAEGQSITDKAGILWTRKGQFITSEDGRKVRADGSF